MHYIRIQKHSIYASSVNLETGCTFSRHPVFWMMGRRGRGSHLPQGEGFQLAPHNGFCWGKLDPLHELNINLKAQISIITFGNMVYKVSDECWLFAKAHLKMPWIHRQSKCHALLYRYKMLWWDIYTWYLNMTWYSEMGYIAQDTFSHDYCRKINNFLIFLISAEEIRGGPTYPRQRYINIVNLISESNLHALFVWQIKLNWIWIALRNEDSNRNSRKTFTY